MSSSNPPPQYQQPVHQTVIVHVPQVSQVLPALVNAFCMPGLGQLIQGRLIAAIFWWILYGFAGLSLFIGVGLILVPLCWIGCILDAATYDPNASSSGTAFGAFILGGTATIVCAVALLALLGIFAVTTTPTTTAVKATPSRPQVVLPSEPSRAAEVTEPEPQRISTDTTSLPPSSIITSEPSVRPNAALAESEPVENLKVRTWTSEDGKFSTTAEFRSMGGGIVKLRKQDGSEISVPLEKLSNDDQRWIDQYRRSK